MESQGIRKSQLFGNRGLLEKYLFLCEVYSLLKKKVKKKLRVFLGYCPVWLGLVWSGPVSTINRSKV